MFYIFVTAQLCFVPLPHEGGRTLIVDMIFQNDAIRPLEMQQKAAADKVHLGGLDSVSLVFSISLECDSERSKDQRFQYMKANVPSHRHLSADCSQGNSQVHSIM